MAYTLKVEVILCVIILNYGHVGLFFSVWSENTYSPMVKDMYLYT